MANNFTRRFFTAQTLSMLGSWIQQLALLNHVYRNSPSSLMLALYMPSGQIPLILGLAKIGAIADRIGRGKTWMYGQTAGLCLATLGAMLSYMDAISWGVAFVFNVGLGIVSTMDISSRQGFVLDNSKSAHHAIAIDSMALNMARLIGPIVGGIVLAQYGVTMCFIANMCSYAMVLYILRDVFHKPPVEQTHENTPTDFNVKGPWLRIAIAVGGCGAATMPSTVQYAAWNATVLHGDATSLGWMFACVGLGSLIVNAVLSKYANKRFREKCIYLGLCCMLASYMVAMSTTNLMVGLLSLCMQGSGIAMAMSSLQTLAQQYVPVKNRALSVSLLQRTYLLCGMCTSLVIGWLIPKTQFNLLWLSSSVMVCLTFIWLYHQSQYWRYTAVNQDGVT